MSKEVKVKIIAGVFSIIVAIIGIVPPMITYINEKREEKATEVQKLLELAEEYYLQNNYEGVAQVYSDRRLKDNPKALLNIGVMYANGIYYKEDEEQATYYFRQALNKGETYYSIQYLLHMLDYENIDEIIELVKKGCDNNSKWCEKILQRLYEKAEIQCTGSYLLDFSERTEEEKKSILENIFILYDQVKYEVCTEYKYTAKIDEEGNYYDLQAECVDVEEQAVDVFINTYVGDVDIKMIFD